MKVLKIFNICFLVSIISFVGIFIFIIFTPINPEGWTIFGYNRYISISTVCFGLFSLIGFIIGLSLIKRTKISSDNIVEGFEVLWYFFLLSCFIGVVSLILSLFLPHINIPGSVWVGILFLLSSLFLLKKKIWNVNKEIGFKIVWCFVSLVLCGISCVLYVF